MSATPRHCQRSLPRMLDRAMEAMSDVMADRRLPLNVRHVVCKAHAALHACRSPETVKRMESEMGLR